MSAKQYIGVKVVQAVPAKMVNGFIWPEGLPLPEQKSEPEGCCSNEVSVNIETGYCVLGDNVYPEWVSKEAFERAYRETDGMDFGLAVEAMKSGLRVARWAWYRQSNETYPFLADQVECHANADLSEFEDLEEGVHVSDMLVLRTEKATLMPGWLPSQEDILAEDWYIVDKYDSSGEHTTLPI